MTTRRIAELESELADQRERAIAHGDRANEAEAQVERVRAAMRAAVMIGTGGMYVPLGRIEQALAAPAQTEGAARGPRGDEVAGSADDWADFLNSTIERSDERDD